MPRPKRHLLVLENWVTSHTEGEQGDKLLQHSLQKAIEHRAVDDGDNDDDNVGNRRHFRTLALART